MASDHFKAIVVGGGPAGLACAYAFSQAGFDFVVLEARDDVVVDRGAAVVLGPNNLRVMKQFGILDQVLEIGAELVTAKGFLKNGREFKNTKELQVLKENHGLGLVIFHRAHLLRVLFDNLPSRVKARFHTGKKVTAVEPTSDGVTVTCSDGSTYEGSIVVGADGAHSPTRRVLRALALGDDPKGSWDPEVPFVAEYRCMWCSFPAPSGPGESFEIPDRGRSVMYLTGKERGWIMLYEKLPQPTRERRTYTDEDVAAFAARFADYPVNAQLHVRDVFARRLTWGMSDLGEGVAGRWSGAGGRIVLVGDACHKFTPNAGLGLNNAIQDVVVLSNGLWRALREAENSDGPSGNRLDGETLSEVFRRYHAARQEPLQKDYGRSALVTRLQAWATPLHYVLSRFVFSFAFVAKLVTRFAVSPLLSRGLVLDYVPSSDLPAGKVPWEHRMPSSSSQ